MINIILLNAITKTLLTIAFWVVIAVIVIYCLGLNFIKMRNIKFNEEEDRKKQIILDASKELVMGLEKEEVKKLFKDVEPKTDTKDLLVYEYSKYKNNSKSSDRIQLIFKDDKLYDIEQYIVING